jgi:formylglycine-generating enzyme required for sulfatase activity
MAGNAWAWTSTLHHPYPYRADDGREDALASGERVLRGGSWFHGANVARAAYRSRYRPGDGLTDSGLRLALGSPQ